MPLNYAALKAEIVNDTAALGYAAYYTPGKDQQVADVLNFVRDGTTACPTNGVVGAAVTLKRADIKVSDVYAAVLVADYTALPTTPTNAQLSTERRYLGWLGGLAALGTVRLLNDDGTDTPVIANFRQMFAPGTPTLNRLLALTTRSGSRAEAVFGAGVSISADDVGKARLS